VRAGFATDSHPRSVIPTSIMGLASTAAAAQLFRMTATRQRWNPRLGNALAGMQIGITEGLMLGALVGRGREHGRTTTWTIAAVTTALTTALFASMPPRRGGQRAGMFWAFLLASVLQALPFATRYDRADLLGWGAVAGGAVALGLGAVGNAYHW